jgi:4-diphosphocytidyl-2-C-methyl-D-erythritol kinase
MQAAEVRARAKINLCLRVGPARPDGYHDVATVLAALAVGDVVELEPAAATRVEAPGLTGGDALVTRALALLAERAGHPAGWRVRLDKQIPVGAGLGGGSADAAAALRLANATLPEPLAPDELMLLAGEVGSDVPFLVSGLDTALARGRGEVLEPCPVRAPAWIVLGWPGVSLGTAEVYALHEPGAGARERVESLIAQPFASDDVTCLAALIENDLSPAAEQLCPPIASLRARLLAEGALAAAMSGSGSAVFGLFAGEDAARSAADRVAGAVPWAAVSRLAQPAAGATITL